MKDNFYFRSVLKAAVLCGLYLLSRPATAQAPRADLVLPSDQSDRYIVIFVPGSTFVQRFGVALQAGATPLQDLRLIRGITVRIPNINILSALQANPAVISIVPDRRVFGLPARTNDATPDYRPSVDRRISDAPEVVPAGVKRVGEPLTGSEGRGVGILIGDTGIDRTDPDLNVAPDIFDAFGGDCMDKHGHGTHVAGTAAALMNGIGVVGVAPGATLYCGKVLGDDGSGSDSGIIKLLEWVVERNAAGANPPILVVNLSLGRTKQQGDWDGPVREAIQAAYKAGVTIIVAAGNDPATEVKYQVPAGFPEVIAVASTTALDGSASMCPFLKGTIPADSASYFTTDGAFDWMNRVGVTISAPGGTRENVNRFCRIECEGILSTAIGGGTTSTLDGSPACGTSMAAPHVSGLAARLIEAGVAGPENIRSWLRSNADRQESAPLDSKGVAYTYDGEKEGVAAWLRKN